MTVFKILKMIEKSIEDKNSSQINSAGKEFDDNLIFNNFIVWIINLNIGCILK